VCESVRAKDDPSGTAPHSLLYHWLSLSLVTRFVRVRVCERERETERESEGERGRGRK